MVGVIIALVYLAVARGLTRGLAALVAVLSLASGCYQAIIHPGSLRYTAIVSAVLAVIVLILLFSPRANAFFRSR